MPMDYLLAFAIGVMIPLQAAINNDLRNLLGGSVLLATLVSFTVGSLVALLLCLGTQRYSALAQLPQAHWWQLSGGALGVAIVFGGIVLAPRIGLAGMVALIVAGQICASLVFDRYGLLGLTERPVSLSRVLGALLVFAGVVLVNGGLRR